jgi:Zn-dependent protease
MTIRGGSLKLFRVWGITVWLHWSWLLAAYFFYSLNGAKQWPIFWGLLYCTMFAIVLMHEFGHSLACRSVGGQADTIMLWPLGGVAFAQPPHRPGATLWTIFAGPLVNIILVPITIGVLHYVANHYPNTYLTQFVYRVTETNLIILFFNMLPIYPLDGGQILQSLLWFVLGFVRSLQIVAIIGLIGAAGIIALAFSLGWAGTWTGIMGLFIGLQAWTGFRRAQEIAELARQHELQALIEKEAMRQIPPPLPPAEHIDAQPPPRYN